MLTQPRNSFVSRAHDWSHLVALMLGRRNERSSRCRRPPVRKSVTWATTSGRALVRTFYSTMTSAGCAPARAVRRGAGAVRLPPRHLDPPSWLAPHMFEFDGSASYVLKRQARALTALEGDTDRNRFLVASLELRDTNELQVLDFNEDTNEVVCMRAYTHPHETWHMASCPAPEHVELVTTVYSTGTEQRAVRPRPRHPHHPHHPHRPRPCARGARATHTQRAARISSATVPSPAQTLWRLDGLDDGSERSDGTGAPPAPPAATPPTELLQLGGAMRLGESRGVLWNAVLPEQVCVLREGALSAFQLSHGGAASSRRHP